MELNSNRGTHYLSGGTADYVRPYVVDRRPRHHPHLPQRPRWMCKVCQDPWPCEPARLLLLVEYRRNLVSLSIYMTSFLTDAVQDLHRLNPNPGPDSAELFDRFLAWTRPPRERDQPT